MKTKIAVTMVALVTIAFLAGCATVVPKVTVPVVKEAPKTYDLYNLYLTTDAQQETGVSRNLVKLGVGETITVYARGCTGDKWSETGGEWFVLPEDVTVEWIPDKELEVTPTVGHVVTIKLVSKPDVVTFVKAVITTKDGKKVEQLFMVDPDGEVQETIQKTRAKAVANIRNAGGTAHEVVIVNEAWRILIIESEANPGNKVINQARYYYFKQVMRLM